MKFRQLNLNPFQKHRGRTKKKSKKQEHAQSKSNIDPEVNADPTDPDYNKRREFSDTDLAKSDENSIVYEHECGNLDITVDIKTQYRLDSFCNHGSENIAEDRIEVQCTCCKLLPEYCNASKDGDFYDIFIQDKGSDSDIDQNSNTLRKVRSRIKTNPWLPSPKLTPGSIHPGAIFSDSDSDSCGRSDYRAEIVNDFFRLNSERKLCNSDIQQEEQKTADKCLSESDLKHKTEIDFALRGNCTRTPRVFPGLQIKDDLNNYRWSIISEGDIDLNSPTIENLREQFSNLEHKVSFQYEDNVDSALECEDQTCKNNRLSIIDLLDDEPCTSDSTSSLESYLTSSVDMTSSVELSTSRESSIMTDSDSADGILFDSLTRVSPIPETTNNDGTFQNSVIQMDDSIDAGYSSLSRDGRMSSSESDSDGTNNYQNISVQIESNANGEITEESPDRQVQPNGRDVDDVDSYSDFSKDLECEFSRQPSGRPFSEVKLSLEEKVNRLRLEKMIVEQKIRKAQEAEKIRLQEHVRYKQKLSEERKDVLIDTLNDLRTRLQDQSDRLQQNYSKVLSIQKRYCERRRSFLFVESA